jgi:hypothetical protein
VTRPLAALLAAALCAAALPSETRGFSNVKEGDLIEDEDLPGLDGGKQPLLGRARVSVFTFFRPAQDHSLDVLQRMAKLEKEFGGKPVRFVAVVSDSWPAEEVRAVAQDSGIRMPVLWDRGDALYGKLGVRLHPVVGIADGQHRLAAYEHFRKVNMEEVVRARIRRALGEIDDAQLARVLEPPRATMPGDDVRFVARRDWNLGKILLQKKSWDKALAAARKAQERDPTFAAAHTLAGQALAGLGQCKEAVAEFEAALKLDPGDSAAADGRNACGR